MGKNISLNRNYISIKEQDVLTQLIVVVCKTPCFFYMAFYVSMQLWQNLCGTFFCHIFLNACALELLFGRYFFVISVKLVPGRICSIIWSRMFFALSSGITPMSICFPYSYSRGQILQ